MRFDNRKILAAIVATTLLLFPPLALSTGPLRIGFGSLLVIFLPGYTLLSALFPKRDDLSGTERLVLSFGVSIAVVPLIGLILNYTPWGIRPHPILISITLFIVATSAVGWYRQQKLTAADRFGITLGTTFANWRGMSKLYTSLSIFLVVAIVAALGLLSHAVAVPKQDEGFTEFYILGAEGKAEDYPKQVLLGQASYIVIGVVNHEHQPASYRVRITIDGIEDSEVDIGTLAHEEKREESVSFIPQAPGEKQRVDLYLYKNGEDEPYFEDPLHLYIHAIPSR